MRMGVTLATVMNHPKSYRILLRDESAEFISLAPFTKHITMRNTLVAVLAIFTIVNAHMWIYDPNPNRFGPNGGTSGLSNTGGGNLGHDAARTGSTANPCAGVAFNAANAKKLTSPATVIFFSHHFSLIITTFIHINICDIVSFFSLNFIVYLEVDSNRCWKQLGRLFGSSTRFQSHQQQGHHCNWCSKHSTLRFLDLQFCW